MFGIETPGQLVGTPAGDAVRQIKWVFADGRYRGDLWLAWDMSDRKGLEDQRERLLEAELAARRSAQLVQRQLEQQNEKLRELDEAMRAETRSLTPDGAQFLDIIERNAHRLLRLVGDLLLLMRLESGSIPLELAPHVHP
jgi:signal transduction histidine kinase